MEHTRKRGRPRKETKETGETEKRKRGMPRKPPMMLDCRVRPFIGPLEPELLIVSVTRVILPTKEELLVDIHGDVYETI